MLHIKNCFMLVHFIQDCIALSPATKSTCVSVIAITKSCGQFLMKFSGWIAIGTSKISGMIQVVIRIFCVDWRSGSWCLKLHFL